MSDIIISADLVELGKDGSFLDFKFASGKVARLRCASVEQGEPIEDDETGGTQLVDESSAEQPAFAEPAEGSIDESGVPYKPRVVDLEFTGDSGEQVEGGVKEPPAEATDTSEPQADDQAKTAAAKSAEGGES